MAKKRRSRHARRWDQTLEKLAERTPPQPRCSADMAARFRDLAEWLAAQHALAHELAHAALARWPEAPETHELRTALLELAARAEVDAAGWLVARDRMDRVGDDHVHLVARRLIPADGYGPCGPGAPEDVSFEPRSPISDEDIPF